MKKFELPPLPYAYDALEPYIDEQTVRIHHDKHHAGYVNGLNGTVEKIKNARETGDFGAIKHLERDVAFNGSGAFLHGMYWKNMGPNKGGEPAGAIAEQIKKDFGSFEAFKNQFSAATKAVEGSGWGVLVFQVPSQSLEILQIEKHQNLTQWFVVPLLVCDVWEHAYYLKYQNNRGGYVDNWWNLVNWDDVNERLAKAKA